jgi:hypothetical protein
MAPVVSLWQVTYHEAEGTLVWEDALLSILREVALSSGVKGSIAAESRKARLCTGGNRIDCR